MSSSSNMNSEVSYRLNGFFDHLSVLESKILGNQGLVRVKNDLLRQKLYSCKFERVPPNYYDLSLDDRAKILNSTSSQLCKSIIFENTACDHFQFDDPTNSRYYCVIVQYEAKFDAERLRTVVHELREPSTRLPKKRFHFVLADQDISYLMTGFGHNAISPFGSLVKIPIVVCSRCTEVNPSYLFLGGGEVDVKLGISVPDLISATGAIVARISDAR